jgi:MtrB/PioB family decaheme-associated outer membrane protein
MKTDYRNLAVRALTLAVQGALAAMVTIPAVALAEGTEDVAALTNPTNFLELGGLYVPDSSAKYGEYNGLDKRGGYVLGNFGVLGGDSYGEGTGTMRWGITGTDLGTTSRNVGASVSDQGTWSLGVGFDELRHNITNTYQTPFLGSMGGNNFTLPSNFGVINTLTTSVNGVLTSASKGSQTLTPTQLSDFQTQNVYSERQNSSFSAGYNFDPQWGVKFDFNHLDQSGAKLIGSGTDKAIIGALTFGGEDIDILMNPTDYTTDTLNFALNWGGDKGQVTASYYASLFRDHYSGVSWQSPFVNPGPATGSPPGTAFPVSTMSLPPSNAFQQLNLTGGYAFTSATRLAGGLSYGRNTQNESYDGTYTPGRVPGLPVDSLNGLVDTTHGDLKLSNQTTKDLSLSAGVTYNERDNKTPSNTYEFYDLGTTTATPPSTAGAATVINIPMSNSHTQLDLGGDYRIDSRQNLHAGYEYDEVKRWCDSSPSEAQIMAASTGIGSGAGALALAQAYYNSGSSCTQVPKDAENKLALNYRIRATDAVSFNAGYSYGDRKATINPGFYNPMQGKDEGFELPGYVAYFDASRNEQLVKAAVTWQAMDQLNLGLNARYTQDNYTDSSIGAQTGDTTSVNLDATYSLSRGNTISAYASWQDRKRDFTNDQWGSGATNTSHAASTYNTSGNLPWSNDLTDQDKILGIGAKQNDFMGGKLKLAEDLTYSIGTTSYSTSLGFTPLTGALPGTPNLINCGPNGNISCGSLPDIKSNMLQFKLSGSYQISKPSTILAGYTFQRLETNDYFYNPYQYTFTPTSEMPTNQLAPNYTVNVVYLAYSYSFR